MGLISLFFSVSPRLRVRQFFRLSLWATSQESFDIRGHKDENCAGATIGGFGLASKNDEQALEPEQEAVPKDQQKNAEKKPKELGGPSGPEPTRYGDWERKGRCIDF